MRYVQPYGITDLDAPYINGDPSIGRQGSIPPAAAFEHPMREIVGVISKSQITPSESDLLQLVKAVRSQRINFASDTGATNAMVVAYDPPITGYTIGLPLRVLVLRTNTSSTVTLDAGAGSASVKKMDGTNPAIGDLPAGAVIEVTWSGTVWQLTNFVGAPASGPPVITNIGIPYCVDSSNVANQITAVFSPALDASKVVPGTPILVKVANTNTGATAIKVNALPNAVVYPRGDTPSNPPYPPAVAPAPCVHSDMVAGDVVLFVYDGTAWWITPDPVIVADGTINVPAQYATPALALAALKRKLIAPTATVTIRLAAGVYQPFTVNHPNADRISIVGTMLAAAPAIGDFTGTGNSAAARAADTNSNLAMLRTRYGTEVRFTSTTIGIQCLSALAPTISDMLLVGDGTPVPTTPGGSAGVSEGAGCGIYIATAMGMFQRLVAINVAVCSASYAAFYGGGEVRLVNCWGIGSRVFNMVATATSKIFWNGGGCQSADNHGVVANMNSGVLVFGCTVRYNGGAGVCSNDNSYLLFSGSTSLGNVAADVYALICSCIKTFQSTFATSSPAASPTPVVGNYNSLIITS